MANPLANGLGGGTDLGLDLDCFDDLNPQMQLVDGWALLGQDIVHRLTTPRGALPDDPDYGTDTRSYLNAAMTPAVQAKLSAEVQAECLKDERVQTCLCNASFTLATSTLTLNLNISTSTGPFSFVLSISAVSVTLLQPAGSAS